MRQLSTIEKVCLSLSVILFLILCTITAGKNTAFTKVVNSAEDSDVINDDTGFVKVTAAHIPESDFPNWSCVYYDDETDVAVYINNEYDPVLPEIGTTVTFKDSSTGYVVDVDDNGFYVKQDVNTAVHGFSGTAVVSDSGTYLGFVSSMDSDGIVYCVAY